jgi:CarboxypepD_reg-like domain/Secretion system C-terminal sorting domain
MSKHIQLSIDNPCHENWDNMTQADKGRFCTACQKQVVDFTNMSDSQIAAFFKKPVRDLSKDGSVCGRFFQDQLDRDIEIPKKRILWVKYFFQFALPAFLVSMKATAQGKVIVKSLRISRAHTESRMMSFTVSKDRSAALIKEILLQGKVVDEDKNPVPFASVMIKGGNGLGVSADSTGAFSIEKIVFEKDLILEVSSVGYITKEIMINKENDLTKEIVVQLDRRTMENIVVVAPQTAMGAFRVGGVCIKAMGKREIETPVIKSPAEIPSMIKVYPNPVVSGTNINIGCQKLKEGYYTIQLTNQSGQQMLNRQTWIDGEIQVLNIDIPTVAAGVYFLKLTNKEANKRFTQKIIVQ